MASAKPWPLQSVPAIDSAICLMSVLSIVVGPPRERRRRGLIAYALVKRPPGAFRLPDEGAHSCAARYVRACFESESFLSSNPSAVLARTFSDFAISDSIVRVLFAQGITEPTTVQSAVIPDALSGENVLGRARTGSGKTLAFGIPVVTALAGAMSRPNAPRGLIVLPTRELATQVSSALEPMASALGLQIATVYGGTSIERQIKRLRSGADIIIATPGRLEDLISRGACTLDDVGITVLDEADHLCDLGFFKPIDRILSQTNAGGQRLLLSATLDGQVDRLVRTHLPRHVLHEVESPQSEAAPAEHHVVVTEPTQKKAALTDILSANPRTIVFTRTRRGAMNLARQLTRNGIIAVDLHGDLSQRHRERNLRRFSSGEASVVVATDVAARGIHVDEVGLVVHYDAPAEHKAFLHRSGRTARAGQSGAVITMTTPQDVTDVARMQKKAGVQARHHDARTMAKPMTIASMSGAGTGPPAVAGGSRNQSRNRKQRSGRRRQHAHAR